MEIPGLRTGRQRLAALSALLGILFVLCRAREGDRVEIESHILNPARYLAICQRLANQLRPRATFDGGKLADRHGEIRIVARFFAPNAY